MKDFFVTYALPCISAFIASIGFSIYYNIKNINVFLCALGGGLGWMVYLLVFYFCNREQLPYFFAALFVTLYSEIMARIRKAPVTVFLTVSLIPLVPGKAIFCTMESIFSRSKSDFIHYLISTFETSTFLAMGVLIMAFLIRLLFAILKHKKINS